MNKTIAPKKTINFLFLTLILFSQINQAQEPIEVVDPLQQIKETSSKEEQLKILETALTKNQLSNPKLMYPYAKAYDSIASFVKNEEINVSAINFNGNAHYANEDYENAIRYYLQAVKILEKKEPSKRLSQIYNNLAGCYRVRDDFKNTEKYFVKALDIGTALKDNPWIANLKNNLAVVYMDEKQFKKADQMYTDALAIYDEAKDTLMMGITLMNQGNSRISSKNYAQAITQYETSQKYVPITMVPLLHAVSQTGIGIAYTELGNYNKALPYLEKGTNLAKKINHTEQLMESYVAFSSYYSKTNSYKDAFAYQEKAQVIKDSITTSQQDKNMADALTKYEAEKKDAELKVLALEKEKEEKQKTIFGYLALAGILVAGVIGFLLFRNRKKNVLLAKQKKLLEATVDEKNVLLKETHHRVKNSFQIVSSLLYLQAETIEDKEAQLAMKEAQNRVRSMVLIHQKLYSKEQLVGIDTKEYFTDLTQDIFESNTAISQNITYTLDVASLVLSIETITPLGLILNELITNVLKHAYKADSKDKKLHIQLYKENEKLVLAVADNGKGMTGDIEETSFGIKLMTALAKKLKARLDFKDNTPQGTVAFVTSARFNEL